MITKPHILVLLTFLVLGGMIVSPVSADLISAYTIGGSTAGYSWGNDYWFNVNNISALSDNLEQIIFVGTCYKAGPLTGSVGPYPLLAPETGNATISWTVDSLTNYSAPCTITVNFTDFHSPGTGATTFAIDSPTTPNTDMGGVPYIKGNGTIPVGEYNLAIYEGTASWINAGGYYEIIGATAPTPTPTPTPEPTPLPGYVRNTFVTVSATTLNTIHGSNIYLYDTYSNTWSNSTSDADGSFYIDTLPFTTINAYATFTVFANEFADAELLGVSAGSAGTDYMIKMYPISSPPPAGSVNLFVTTMDNYGNILRDASVYATWGGVTHAGTSGTYGTYTTVVTNNTQVHLRAEKSGYNGAEAVINTGTGTSYAWTLYLTRETVSPTSTVTPDPSGTIPTTYPTGVGPDGYDEGYSNMKATEWMNWLAEHGFILVELCFFVTICALLGFKFGK